MAACLHRAKWRLAGRHAVRGPRSQLSRPVGRLEIHLSSRRCHSGRAAGRHEWLQVSTAPVDQRFHSNLQETIAYNLAQSASLSHQARSNRPFDVELRLPAACVSMCPSASVRRSASGGVGAHNAGGFSCFSCGVGLGSRFLCLRSTRAASAYLDAGNSFPTVSACPRRWSVAE